MMDFTNLPEDPFRLYNGANGKKKCLLINNEPYMVKIMDNDSDGNIRSMSAYSEYVGCHIFDLLGIPTQETILGTYTSQNKTYLAVACKDFCEENDRLQDFSNIRNSIVSSSASGNGKELYPILLSIEEQKLIPVDRFKERFWDMFVIDALIGNFDRHSGNFGVLMNNKTKKVELAPVYDCGSSLYPSLSDDMLPEILNNKDEILARVYEFPASTYRDADNKKIKYHTLLMSDEYPECTSALKKLKPIMDEKFEEICIFINNTHELSNIRKKFYTEMLKYRKALIIDNSYNLLKENEKIKSNKVVPNIEKIHHREKALQENRTFTSKIANEYALLFRMIEYENGGDKHKRNSDTDAIIISILRKEGYTTSEIKKICEQLSPSAVGRNDYAGRMFVKAKLPKFAKITRDNLMEVLHKSSVQIDR